MEVGQYWTRPPLVQTQLDMQNDWNRQKDRDRQSQSASLQKDEPRSPSQEAERERVHSEPDKGSDVRGRDWQEIALDSVMGEFI